ncbi:MAG: tRNA preQ1(34) S-adenosylmethionine ribosyltransferase-isomerase QueA [Verrucomicrobia bacterium]|nr:tRNA preQ1(34) S-adenosylmethionine ribosyltransferase-isomerase QueA [Verrucomicrobiota bacterium]
MRTVDFDYSLPPELIAQAPVQQRDQSRLLILDRASGALSHKQFPQLLDYLRAGDVLVLNNSKVIPARLRARNPKTGGQFEILLIEENGTNDWWAMMRPGKRARIGMEIQILDAHKEPSGISVVVQEVNSEGHRRLQFKGTDDILNHLDALGELPLPPYIERDKPQAEDLQRYQTVYAQAAGSVAAPTAGLHFTPELLKQISEHGVKVCYVTLHVGLGTFAPVKAENLSEHIMHTERFEVNEETAQEINLAKKENRRVIAVGTTSVRVLESVAENHSGKMAGGSGRTNIFIFPPHEFKIVDALVTNFHLPCSTLLMLVSAFAAPTESRGREMVLSAYAEAIRERYRFFSYGDAMFIV